jgi:hypothetical protein
MAFPEERPFISLQEASTRISKVQECTIDDVRFFIDKKYLNAYAPTPSHVHEPPGEYLVPPRSLAEFWEQSLFDYCRLKRPIKWSGEWITCSTIVVCDISGAFPTVIEPIKGLGPDGEMTPNYPWKFQEKDVFLKTEEVRRFIEKCKAGDKEELGNTAVEPVQQDTKAEESPEEYVVRRSKEHPIYFQLVTELKERFPTLNNSSIGRLLFPPNITAKDNIDDRTTGKRIERILKKEGRLWKNKVPDMS